MDATKSHVKIYNITPEMAEDFQFDFSTGEQELLTELVPSQSDWGELSWGIEFEDYEYNPHDHTMHFGLETKWEPPVDWLVSASKGTPYFENKLITMSTIQKDETCVTGVAVMDGELLQNKVIWSMDPSDVAKFYDDDHDEYDLDELDNKIWDSIGQFVNVCEKFYLADENTE